MRILFVSLLLLLAACGSVLPEGRTAPQLYTLNTADITKAANRLPYRLEITQPQAKPGLDNNRIALRRDANRLDYFADTRWAGELNTLLQTLLVSSFDHSQALQAVGNDLVSMNKDYSLLVEIHAFEADYENDAPVAHVKLAAKLIRLSDKTIISTHMYEAQQAPQSKTMAAMVQALDQAWQQASQQLVQENLEILAQQGR